MHNLYFSHDVVSMEALVWPLLPNSMSFSPRFLELDSVPGIGFGVSTCNIHMESCSKGGFQKNGIGIHGHGVKEECHEQFLKAT